MVNDMMGTFTVIIHPKGHLVLFDGYESHDASKITFHQIKPYITVNATLTSADQECLAQPVQITNILQRNEGQPPTDGTTQQVEEQHDGHVNEGIGGGGWGSGSTPHVFRQSSGDSYCDTPAIHDTKVRDLQRKIDEEAVQSRAQRVSGHGSSILADRCQKDLQSSLDAANSEFNAAKSELDETQQRNTATQQNNDATQHNNSAIQ
jgi:hypothetical protein